MGYFQPYESPDKQSYGGTAINSDAQNNFDVNESLSWIKGKHTFKFGFEYLKSQSNDAEHGWRYRLL